MGNGYVPLDVEIFMELKVGDTDKYREDEVLLEGLPIRQLRNWVHDSLKREECVAAHRLLQLLNLGVWWQAHERGMADAYEVGEVKLSSSATPLWKDGYETGFAKAMSQRADDADLRDRGGV